MQGKNRKTEALKEARQDYLDALCSALQTPCGRKVLQKLLKDTGMAGRMEYDAGSVAKYNFGMSLFEDMLEAHPEAAYALLREICRH